MRAEHRELDGIILAQDDKRWKEIYPPNGWNCRCYVVARLSHEVDTQRLKESKIVVDEFQKGEVWQKAKEQGWGVNRAETGIIYGDGQQYVKELTLTKTIEDLHCEDYNLPSFREAMKEKVDHYPVYEGTAEEWYDKHVEKTLQDYKGRTIPIPKDTFGNHSSNKKKNRAYRVEFLKVAEEALIAPDEVWLNTKNKEFDSLCYIKFYQDKAFCVICQLENGYLSLKSWFDFPPPIDTPNIDEKHPHRRYRRGLLIKK